MEGIWMENHDIKFCSLGVITSKCEFSAATFNRPVAFNGMKSNVSCTHINIMYWFDLLSQSLNLNNNSQASK